VEQGGSQDLRVGDIHLFSQDSGDRTGMHDVCLAGTAPLIVVGFNGKIQSAPEDISWVIAKQLPHLGAIYFQIKRYIILHMARFIMVDLLGTDVTCKGMLLLIPLPTVRTVLL
jgi:hypothetical protein